MASILAKEIAKATKVLAENGLTPQQALSHVKSFRLGSHVLEAGAPSVLRQTTSRCYGALQMLLLRREIETADQRSLQIGRLWGFASKGIDLTNIAKASRTHLLVTKRGPGGAKENDLTRSLRTALDRDPDADREAILAFLESDEAEYLYDEPENQTIRIVGVETNDYDRLVTYNDHNGKKQTIKFASLDKKLRALRAEKSPPKPRAMKV